MRLIWTWAAFLVLLLQLGPVTSFKGLRGKAPGISSSSSASGSPGASGVAHDDAAASRLVLRGRQLTQEQPKFIPWDSAPDCPGKPGSGATEDTLGRLWGWSGGQSCKYASSSSSSSPTPDEFIAWDEAPACPPGSTAAATLDLQGRRWGWSDGVSCRITEPAKPAKPKPKPKIKGPEPADDVDAAAAASKAKPVVLVPAAPPKQPAAPAVTKPVPVKAAPSAEPTEAPVAAAPAVKSAEEPVKAVPSAEPKQPAATEPAPAEDDEQKPAAGAAAGGAAAAAAAAAAAKKNQPAPAQEAPAVEPKAAGGKPAAAAADKEGQDYDGAVVGPRAKPIPAAAAAAAEPPAAPEAKLPTATNLMLVFRGTPANDFRQVYAAGTLKAVSQLSGVPPQDIVSTVTSSSVQEVTLTSNDVREAGQPQRPQQPQQPAAAAAAAAAPRPAGSSRKLLQPAAAAAAARPAGGSRKLLEPAQQTWSSSAAYAKYMLLSYEGEAVTARIRSSLAGPNGSEDFYNILAANGVPLRPSVVLEGNMLAEGSEAPSAGRPPAGNVAVLQQLAAAVAGRKPREGFDGGAIAAIVIGSVMGLALLVLAAGLFVAWKRERARQARKLGGGHAQQSSMKSKAQGKRRFFRFGGRRDRQQQGQQQGQQRAAGSKQHVDGSDITLFDRMLPARTARWLSERSGSDKSSRITGRRAADAAAVTAAAAAAAAAAVAAARKQDDDVEAGKAAAAAKAEAEAAAAAAAKAKAQHAARQKDVRYKGQHPRPDAAGGGNEEDDYYSGDEGGGASTGRSKLSAGIEPLKGKDLASMKAKPIGNRKFLQIRRRGRSTTDTEGSDDDGDDEVLRPMSIRRREKLDELRQAQQQGPAAAAAAAADAGSDGGSEGSRASSLDSAGTFNSLEPMERSVIASTAVEVRKGPAGSPAAQGTSTAAGGAAAAEAPVSIASTKKLPAGPPLDPKGPVVTSPHWSSRHYYPHGKSTALGKEGVGKPLQKPEQGSWGGFMSNVLGGSRGK